MSVISLPFCQRPIVTVRILVADDFGPRRSFVGSLLREAGWQVVGEVSDGSEAIQKAQELQPDVILLDIELPNLNGIEAARQICKVLPKSKILFLSLSESVEIVTEALRTGASGYVVKYDVASELVKAVEAVFRGKRSISGRLKGLTFLDGDNRETLDYHSVQETKIKIEVFSAGCSACNETIEMVKRIAGSSHEVVIHDMHKPEVSAKAKQHGVRSVPAVVIDGKLAGCCAGRGPDEHVLRSALA